jgi:glycosyltransferase involved in cell wall biosynthesis
MEYLSHYYVVTIYSLSESEGIVAHNWGISSQSSWLKKIYDSIPWFNKKIGKYFSYWPNEVENLTFSLALLPKLLKERYDIFFPVSIWGVLIGRLVRTLVGTKIVYVNHGGAENFILFQKPDRFIALTPDVFDWAQQKHAEVDSRWIPCGVDLKRFNPHIKPASLSLEKPVFLCVAAATAYKNIETTIQAVSGLKKGSLLVIAKGEREKEIEKLGDSLLGRKRFLMISSFIPDAQMPSYYTAADVFTLASGSDEIFGAVFLEALASGLPVVANNDERKKMIIGKAGVLCPINNIGQYTTALNQAANFDFGQLPYRQVRKYSLDRAMKQYHRLVEEMVVKSSDKSTHQ